MIFWNPFKPEWEYGTWKGLTARRNKKGEVQCLYNNPPRWQLIHSDHWLLFEPFTKTVSTYKP